MSIQSSGGEAGHAAAACGVWRAWSVAGQEGARCLLFNPDAPLVSAIKTGYKMSVDGCVLTAHKTTTGL